MSRIDLLEIYLQFLVIRKLVRRATSDLAINSNQGKHARPEFRRASADSELRCETGTRRAAGL
jgi:hypothetical protein